MGPAVSSEGGHLDTEWLPSAGNKRMDNGTKLDEEQVVADYIPAPTLDPSGLDRRPSIAEWAVTEDETQPLEESGKDGKPRSTERLGDRTHSSCLQQMESQVSP